MPHAPNNLGSTRRATKLVRKTGVYWPLVFLVGLAVFFFGSLIFAATLYPGGYDWRYRVMSSLANPKENPQAYHIAAGGMAIGGVCLSFLGLCIRNSLQHFAPSEWTKAAAIFFVLGGTLNTVSAIITPGYLALWGLQKAHAKFAQAGTFAFDVGTFLTLPALLKLPASKRWVGIVEIILVLLPVSCYLVARIVFQSLSDPGSIKLGTVPPMLGSLPFWEWLGSATVFIYAGIIVLALRPTLPPTSQ
jgi:hypothetical protein